MTQTENTIRFEDFAAVTRDGGEVLGKVLYYSLSSLRIARAEQKKQSDGRGYPIRGRASFGAAFRSATGDVYDRIVNCLTKGQWQAV